MGLLNWLRTCCKKEKIVTTPELDERLKKMLTRIEVVEAWRESDACKTLTKIKVFELSLSVFHRNYGEWERYIEELRPKDHKEVLYRMQTSQWVEEYLVEITRLMHNVTAGAMTLVDTTRVFYNEMYKESGAIDKYQEEINKRFSTDPLARFVIGLRQFCQHVRLPLVFVGLGLEFGTRGITWSIPISKAEVDKFSGWPSDAKKFIANAGNNIDLVDVFAQYKQKIEDFYGWFKAEQDKVHAEAITTRDAFTARMKELAEATGPEKLETDTPSEE